MSLLDKFREGWEFRTTRPAFDSGDELSAFVTGYDGGSAVVRIGDTKLRLPEAPAGLLDKRVLLRVTEFDDDRSVGEGEYLDTVGESAF
jgi:hypothetical protein